MALKITPKDNLEDLKKGEETAYTLDVTEELGLNTIDSMSFKIYDASGTDVTSDFGGGSSVSSGIITFGVIAYDVGKYNLKFIVTCNELLPDGLTPNEFFVNMSVIIS